jgi:hypothetical protein
VLGPHTLDGVNHAGATRSLENNAIAGAHESSKAMRCVRTSQE